MVKQFYNCLLESYNALEVLNEPVESWSSIVLYLVEKKLDSDTLTLWYRQQSTDVSPTFQDLMVLAIMTSTTMSCPTCGGNHFLYNCREFLSLDINGRRDVVKINGLCFNCIKTRHFSRDCKSSGCRNCKLKHNTLLHFGNIDQIDNEIGPETTVSVNSIHHIGSQTTLLATAIIMVRDRTNTL